MKRRPIRSHFHHGLRFDSIRHASFQQYQCRRWINRLFKEDICHLTVRRDSERERGRQRDLRRPAFPLRVGERKTRLADRYFPRGYEVAVSRVSCPGGDAIAEAKPLGLQCLLLAANRDLFDLSAVHAGHSELEAVVGEQLSFGRNVSEMGENESADRLVFALR